MPQFLVSIRLAGLRGKFQPACRWRRVAQLRGCLSPPVDAAWRRGAPGEVRERGTMTFAVTAAPLGNGAHTTAALPPTVPDQMTRASAHNNGLFTLQSYPIPKPRPGIPAPLSTDVDGSALPQFESAREFNIGARNLTLQVPSLNPENADPIWEYKELQTSNVIFWHRSFSSTRFN